MEPDAEQALSRLAGRIRRCTQCPLHEGRRHAVPGEGPARARVMLISEAPGAKEDELGRPFCRLSGRFLDKALAALGMDRKELFITSSVKCRPPGNRTPHRDELATCRRLWLEPQMAVVRPDVVVLLGKVPIGQVIGAQGSLSNLHGRVRQEGGRRYLLTYHPAAAMRFPGPMAAMQRDLRKLKRLLGADA